MPRPLSADARHRLVSAMVDALGELGVNMVTADEIARRSGVPKSTLYRHFGSLDDLVFAAVETDVRAGTPIDTGSLRGDLLEIQRRYLATANQQRARELFAWMTCRVIANEDHRERYRAARHNPGGPIGMAIDRARERGEIDPSIARELAMHLIQGPLISKRIIDDSPVSEHELEALVDAAVRSVAAHPGSKPSER